MSEAWVILLIAVGALTILGGGIFLIAVHGNNWNDKDYDSKFPD